jgi:hypothetical protein
MKTVPDILAEFLSSLSSLGYEDQVKKIELSSSLFMRMKIDVVSDKSFMGDASFTLKQKQFSYMTQNGGAMISCSVEQELLEKETELEDLKYKCKEIILKIEELKKQL